MTHILTQIGIALFGLSALTMAMGNNPKARKWAPIIGLVGQVFWAAHAWQTQAWGVGVLVLAYTSAYAYGVWVQWGRK